MTVPEVVSLAEVRKAARDGRARAVREAASISQVEVANALGVTQACISKWESGERVPRGRAAQEYAQLIQQLARFTEDVA
jgi:DNA-binding transcriptional regulator YiaG